jgi:spoIIIJ-associated protein
MGDKINLIKETAEKIIEYLKISAEIKVEEKDEVFNVQIETPDTGILIGYHGETMTSFQLILSLLVYKKLGSWQRLVVDVGDWRQRREEILKQMADQAREKVLNSNSPVSLLGLSSFERRVIHLYLAENPQVETLSEGEGADRRLIIKPKQKSED